MKALRSFVYVVVAIFLGIFINLLSLSLVLKNVVQKEMVTNLVKSAIASEYFDKKVENGLTEEQQKKVKEFLDDNSANEVLDVFINNYMNYLSDENYKISEQDVNKIKDYVKKHEDVIREISKEDINIDEVLKDFNADTIDKETRKSLEKVDTELPSEVKDVFTTYKSFTVGSIKLALAALVFGSIALLMLISWSLIKWMKATGVCLIVNGVLITLLYLILASIRDLILNNANLGIYIQNITFSTILVIGLVELVLGIALVIAHKIINKKGLNENTNSTHNNELFEEAKKTDVEQESQNIEVDKSKEE